MYMCMHVGVCIYTASALCAVYILPVLEHVCALECALYSILIVHSVDVIVHVWYLPSFMYVLPM